MTPELRAQVGDGVAQPHRRARWTWPHRRGGAAAARRPRRAGGIVPGSRTADSGLILAARGGADSSTSCSSSWRVAPLAWFLFRTTPFVVVVFVVAGLLAASALYPLLAEYHFGKTIGKHLMKLRVVRESGARISFGQSIVRQLPIALEVFWIDVLFALFTEKHQRAFELLSRRAWSLPRRMRQA